MSPAMHDTNLMIDTLKAYGYFSSEIESDIRTRIRSISRKKEREITTWFGYEGVSFASIASFFDGKPSLETIQCLEDCVFQYIKDTDLNELYGKYNEVNTLGRKLVEDYCKMMDERIYSFQTQSAGDRYRTLVRSEPEIVRRVSLGHIASYLGITNETLSRIRKK